MRSAERQVLVAPSAAENGLFCVLRTPHDSKGLHGLRGRKHRH